MDLGAAGQCNETRVNVLDDTLVNRLVDRYLELRGIAMGNAGVSCCCEPKIVVSRKS